LTLPVQRATSATRVTSASCGVYNQTVPAGTFRQRKLEGIEIVKTLLLSLTLY